MPVGKLESPNNVGVGVLNGISVNGFKRKNVKQKARGIRPEGLKHGYLVNEDSGKKLKFQYNPESFYTEHKALYEGIESPGSSYPMLYYCGRPIQKFSFTLNFYGVKNVVGGMSSGDIEIFLKRLVAPKKKQKKLIKGSNHFISPPVCTVVFGAKCWETVVENVKLDRKLFNAKLKTMQLVADVTFVVLRNSNR